MLEGARAALASIISRNISEPERVPGLGKWRKEDQAFEIILSYIVSLSPA